MLSDEEILIKTNLQEQLIIKQKNSSVIGHLKT